MQMISKEDYLVSLRRKSSAFARGIPKYRGVSRQPQSYSEMAGSEYFNNLNCSTSRDVAGEGTYASSSSIARKIDLTGYIRWWGLKKTRQSESVSNAEDVGRELRALESSVQPSEPYQLPSLGFPNKGKPHALSACSILARSAAFKNFIEKSSEKQVITCSKEMDRGKGVPPLFGDSELGTSVVTLGMTDFPVQRTPYALAPLFSAPPRTSWTPVDPIPDPVFWSSLVPQTGQSLSVTLRKNEISPSYTYQCQD